MYHDDRADETCGNAPGSLVRILQCVLIVGVLYAESSGKAVTKVVAGAGLECLSVVHEGLDGVGRYGSGKFLLVGLSASYHGHRKEILAEIGIDVQHLYGAFLCLLLSCVDGVTFLPQKLTGTKERSRLLFPAHYRAPLVVYLGQISVGMDEVFVKITEKSLGCGTHAKLFL